MGGVVLCLGLVVFFWVFFLIFFIGWGFEWVVVGLLSGSSEWYSSVVVVWCRW